MKYAIHIFALLLVLLLALFTLASCSAKPNDDYDALKTALEGKGYGVGLTKQQSDAESFGSEFGIKLNADGLDAMVMATKTNDNYDLVDMIVVFYFKSSDAAQTAYDSGKYETLFKKMVASYQTNNAVELSYSLAGSMFWIGTAQGISDARGK